VLVRIFSRVHSAEERFVCRDEALQVGACESNIAIHENQSVAPARQKLRRQQVSGHGDVRYAFDTCPHMIETLGRNHAVNELAVGSSVDERWEQVWDFLANRGERWIQAFRALSQSEQTLLSAMLDFDGPTTARALRASYETRVSRRDGGHLSFEECVARLDHSFLTVTSSHSGEQYISVRHPSLRDMLLLHLRRDMDARAVHFSGKPFRTRRNHWRHCRVLPELGDNANGMGWVASVAWLILIFHGAWSTAGNTGRRVKIAFRSEVATSFLRPRFVLMHNRGRTSSGRLVFQWRLVAFCQTLQ
jgi:hypothetical protein